MRDEHPNMTLYRADCRGNHRNCIYQVKCEITDTESLKRAVSMDYVCAQYSASYRNTANFITANVLGGDIDNDHSDDPNDWVSEEQVAAAFPEVTYAIHYSRHHQLVKNGRSARPRFHILFQIDPVFEARAYVQVLWQIQELFPFFDTQAMDAARFFYGTESPQVLYHAGTQTLTAYLSEQNNDQLSLEEFKKLCAREDEIPQGQRNSTLSHFAGRVLKRFGDSETAYELFLQRAECCNPPLEESELLSIWHSALKFAERVRMQEGYIAPEDYNRDGYRYSPDDYTDVGEARALARFFADRLRYSPSTDYLRYDGRCWQETKSGAQGIAHELTDLQLEEATEAVASSKLVVQTNGVMNILDNNTKKRAIAIMDREQLRTYEQYAQALEYRAFVLARRESKYVTATLKEARPVLEIDPAILDADWFLLCTPDATYDLRKGLKGAREHRAEDYITKMTSVSPGEKGMEIWEAALYTFFCGDEELIRYVQLVAGIACVGQVFLEAMIIAYGDGRNGKSTFWNTLARIMGSYSGNISADSLTVGCKRNVKPEMAEARGKRLLIAAELEEGTRLNTSTVKQLCSTDNVFAEKKYKDPFSFTPSHTLVLYTNHLPKVGATDTGIWRRLIVIPFKAKIEGNKDIKNYTDYLCENAGEAVLAWMIEGARRAVELGFKLPLPKCVQDAIHAYREQNDWLGHFLNDRCEIDDEYVEKSGELYSAYRAYCMDSNEYIRSTADFYAALEAEGFARQKTRAGVRVFGLRLNPGGKAREEFEDFLK